MSSTAKFYGGPLDGREQSLPAEKAVDGDEVTHVFLHEGPKIETTYRLARTSQEGWEYRVVETSGDLVDGD